MASDRELEGNIPTVEELQRREEELAADDFDIAFEDARLRSREASLLAQRQILAERAQRLDNRVALLERSARAHAVDTTEVLQGLGGGAALEEADVEGYVQRSGTLRLGRAAMITLRAELAARRRAHLVARSEELETYEQAFDRADVRLTARERLILAAARQIEQTLLATGAPAEAARQGVDDDDATQPAGNDAEEGNRVLTDQWRQFELLRHVETVTMAAREIDARTATDRVPQVFRRSRERSGSLAPPTLDTSIFTSVPTFRPASQHTTGQLPNARQAAARRESPSESGGNRQASDPLGAGARTIADAAPIDALDHLGGPELPKLPEVPELPGLPELPDDLPPAAGEVRPHQITARFVSELRLDGQPLARRQIELDRAGHIVLVSAVTGLKLDERVQLIYHNRDGHLRHFSARVQRLLPLTNRGGGAAVLSARDWTEADFDALTAALKSLPS